MANNTFKDKVNQTQEIKNCYKPGLKALEHSGKQKHSNKIKVKDTRKLEGSVNLDNCLKEKYPNANRWDYMFGYKTQTYFVEIHPAYDSQVKKIIEKKKWLTSWKSTTPFKNDNKFYWLPSGKSAVSQRQRKILSKQGVMFKFILSLD